MSFFKKKNSVGLMGIMNVTPDSFSDGGAFDSVNRAVVHALSLQAEGADILDIGGESTRPNSIPVSEEIELERVMPVIAVLVPHAQREALLSIDTYKSKVAEKALSLGVDIVNDVGGLTKDLAMAEVIAHYRAGVVIMHSAPLSPNDLCIEKALQLFFDQTVTYALKAGISCDKIMLDIGIGFGKTLQQNILAIHAISSLRSFRFPLLVGASRKSMIGSILGEKDPQKRLFGTLATHSQAIMQGASWLRIHDVKPHADYFKMKESFLL
jgi:dihydropteroate synthase